MFTIPNQSSVPVAWKVFTTASEAPELAKSAASMERVKVSSNRNRVADVMEELVKITCLMSGKDYLFSDRFSERKEKTELGKLLTQAEMDSIVEADKKRKVSRFMSTVQLGAMKD